MPGAMERTFWHTLRSRNAGGRCGPAASGVPARDRETCRPCPALGTQPFLSRPRDRQQSLGSPLQWNMLLGAHVPTTGGLHLAPGHGRAIGADVIQLFTRNQRQWKAHPVGREEAGRFREAMNASALRLAMSHASYLINLASPDAPLLARSRRALAAELRRCHALGVPFAIVHPGAHMGRGVDSGVARVARSLDHVFGLADVGSVTLLLEVTAGQGTALGDRLEQIAEMIERSKVRDRVGVCLDTCHLYAAGYDLASESGYASALRGIERTVGLGQVGAMHLNDALRPLGSRVDRHAPIGKGRLGRRTFQRLVRDPRFTRLPAVVETPGPLEVWRREIARLRRLARS